MQMILPALRVPLFALATISLAAIAGCGLKGDLVLPEQTGQPSSQETPEAALDERNEPDEPEGRDDGDNRSEARQ